MAISQGSLILASDMTNFAKLPLRANKILLKDVTTTSPLDGAAWNISIPNLQNWLCYSVELQSNTYLKATTNVNMSSTNGRKYFLLIKGSPSSSGTSIYLGSWAGRTGTVSNGTQLTVEERSEYFQTQFEYTSGSFDRSIKFETTAPATTINTLTFEPRLVYNATFVSGFQCYIHLKIYGIF